MTRSNFREKIMGIKWNYSKFFWSFMRLFSFFVYAQNLFLSALGFLLWLKLGFCKRWWLLIDHFLRLIQRLKVVKIIVAVATAIVCEETESSEELSEESSDGTDSPESDSSLWTTQIPLTKLMQFSGETIGTEIVLNRFQFSFSLFNFLIIFPRNRPSKAQ